jgi:hypothetical protein
MGLYQNLKIKMFDQNETTGQLFSLFTSKLALGVSVLLGEM